MIRLARKEDIGRLVEIEKRCFPNQQWQRRDFWRLIDRGKGYFWVSTEWIWVYGYIYITPKNRILSLAAMGDRGIGSRLLRFAEHFCGMLHLEVAVTNKRAIKFYMKHGYVQYGIKKKYYSNGEDALLFRKKDV